MILRLINYAVMGVAIFYALEGSGVIEKGRYFPTLPRLEASASNPYAWLGAAQWGFSQLSGLASAQGAGGYASAGGSSFDTGSLSGMIERVSQQQRNSQRFLSAYGG